MKRNSSEYGGAVVAYLLVCLMLLIPLSISVKAQGYRQDQCRHCRQEAANCRDELKDMTNYVAEAMMSATCDRWDDTCDRICNGSDQTTQNWQDYGSVPPPPIASGGGLKNQNSLPKLKLPPSKWSARRLELQKKVDYIVDYYRKQAETACIMNGRIDTDDCAKSVLFNQLTQPKNVKKIMANIGAKVQEYNMVLVMIEKDIFMGF